MTAIIASAANAASELLSGRVKVRLQTCSRDENMAAAAFAERSSFLITGAHLVIYSKDAAADRAFFRDVLQYPSVDAGGGWLIFAMPPLEAAFHDSESNDRHELYLMCDNIEAALTDLKTKNVPVSEVSEQRWGKLASFTLPGGGKIGIYEPKHPSPLRLKPPA
jgi:hypothetical protein